MGRPSLAGQRRAEILAAFERCVLRDGLAHTTVQAVAQEAGCQRTLINHYFGDMEGLVRALIDTLTGDLAEAFREATASSPGLPAVLDFLFRRQMENSVLRRAGCRSRPSRSGCALSEAPGR